MAKSFAQYFQNAFGDNGRVGYIKAHYDVTGYCQGQSKAINNNILSRIRNAFVMAINKEVLLPMAVIIVLENDILNAANHYKPGIYLLCGKVLEWLANQFHRIITSHKEHLPSKAQKFKYPTVLWVTAPNHDNLSNINSFRDKFNTSLTNICGLYREMSVLNLDWNTLDKSLISGNGKYTAIGMASFWMKLNEAFQAWDKEQMRLSHLSTDPVPKVDRCEQSKKSRIVRLREHMAGSKYFTWKLHKTKFKLPALKSEQ